MQELSTFWRHFVSSNGLALAILQRHGYRHMLFSHLKVLTHWDRRDGDSAASGARVPGGDLGGLAKLIGRVAVQRARRKADCDLDARPAPCL
jgi:hypothetical protein